MPPRPSPLPNRVAPDGDIVATAARGTMMGNRGGRIHEGFEIRRRSASRRWIACALEFKARRREVMGEGYTELFFLDEATALAAGTARVSNAGATTPPGSPKSGPKSKGSTRRRARTRWT